MLTDLLREELGFQGVLLADYTTVLMLLLFHRIAADKAEAAARALQAGLDMELPNKWMDRVFKTHARRIG